MVWSSFLWSKLVEKHDCCSFRILRHNTSSTKEIEQMNLSFKQEKKSKRFRHCRGPFCDLGKKCKISPNLPLVSLQVFICGRSSPKFQMYNEQKANGALTREKSKCHNWNAEKCLKTTQVRNFDSQSARRENWERLWGREGRFPLYPYFHPQILELWEC